MTGFKRIMLAIGSAASLAVATSVTSVSAAPGDYGKTHVYEIEFSYNCNNPSLCGAFLGGAWGWIALNGTRAGGTGDAEVTFCAHTVGGGGPGSAGAQHMSADVVWVNTGTLLLLFMEGSATPVFVAPSKPGHYSYEDVPFFGMPKAPGVAIQLQVVLIPTSA
ncbi:MAG: hypothetical protein E6I07_10915 [Chloroflexi bacterium]|nr:MAG: hypothetical protein E6I07_10915 [Chloroflexota bacterium]